MHYTRFYFYFFWIVIFLYLAFSHRKYSSDPLDHFCAARKCNFSEGKQNCCPRRRLLLGVWTSIESLKSKHNELDIASDFFQLSIEFSTWFTGFIRRSKQSDGSCYSKVEFHEIGNINTAFALSAGDVCCRFKQYMPHCRLVRKWKYCTKISENIVSLSCSLSLCFHFLPRDEIIVLLLGPQDKSITPQPANCCLTWILAQWDRDVQVFVFHLGLFLNCSSVS